MCSRVLAKCSFVRCLWNIFYNVRINVYEIQKLCLSGKSGKRTVGCCSHVASIIYYLSNARYNSSIRNNNLLDKIFTEPVCDDSSDESDTDSDATEVDSDATIIDDDISALGSHTTENVQEMQVNQGNLPSIYPDLSSMNTS